MKQISCLLHTPYWGSSLEPGPVPLTRNQTSNLSVPRTMPQPTEPLGQGGHGFSLRDETPGKSQNRGSSRRPTFYWNQIFRVWCWGGSDGTPSASPAQVQAAWSRGDERAGVGEAAVLGAGDPAPRVTAKGRPQQLLRLWLPRWACPGRNTASRRVVLAVPWPGGPCGQGEGAWAARRSPPWHGHVSSGLQGSWRLPGPRWARGGLCHCWRTA